MAEKTPSHLHKELTLFDLQKMFPTDHEAKKWIENIRWVDGLKCPHCQGTNIQTIVTHKTMDYRCRSCRNWFSVRTGTIMQKSKLPLLHWVYAVYIQTSRSKGKARMQVHRELGITPKTAWLLLHRMRKAWEERVGMFSGPVEVDET
ncbi:MAG: IS1595 family transposase [Rhodobacteraceae bacterium]|nr:IS1595 family transposase [Paracoccaceae bacterium]